VNKLEFETVDPQDVQIGDEIVASFSGVVTGWDHCVRYFSLEGRNNPIGGLSEFHYANHDIRRKVCPRMAEPLAPAVVRHAGRVAVRPLGDESDTRWLLINSGGDDDCCWWKTWADLLALDPTTNPVMVDLGLVSE